MSTEHERRIATLTSALEQANVTLRGKMDELSLVRRVGDAISQHTSTWTLSFDLVTALAETINCKYAVIYGIADGGSCELQAVSNVFSIDENFPRNIQGSRILWSLEHTYNPIRIDDITECPEWDRDWPFPEDLAAWLFVPLVSQNNLRGVLCLADDTPYAFDDKTLRTLLIIVPQISSAFANIDLYNHLRESEKKFRSLVEGIQDVVYICDDKWHVVEANPAATTLFGENILGKSLEELFATQTSFLEFVDNLRQSKHVQNFESELLTHDRKRIVTLVSCVIEGDKYSGVIKDVTERTHLMAQVTQAQKMESIGTLASGVAHDFNNILGIILPNAELIKFRSPAESQIAKQADVICNVSKRAAQLTRQLLSLSRKDAIALRVLDVNESIRATGKLLGETLDRKIRLEFDLASDLLNIKADDTQIEQVLLNLSINARDAMPDGGSIRFSTHNKEGKVVLRVADTGTGIDKNNLPKIFDPFFTTKEKSKGTGLGLSVCYGIVKQMGGTIAVDSTVGKGTEFTITFPSCNEVKRNSLGPDGAPKGGTEKILIVDDEEDIVFILEAALKSLGYTVVSARNGIEALERAGDDIDLIILDMIMPVMDGLTALRGIRQKTPDVKVIVASGYTHPEKMPMLERVGIEGFIHKPFEIAKLGAAIRDVLDGVVA